MDFDSIRQAATLVLPFIVFGAPALAIAARIAIRPVVDAIVRLRETSAATQPPVSGSRITLLAAELTRLQSEVERLADCEAFYRQLYLHGKSPAASRAVASGPFTPSGPVRLHRIDGQEQ